MKCPECGERGDRVDHTAHRKDPDGWSMVVRRRRCRNGHSFETYECYEYADVEVIFKAREAMAILASISLSARP